jgi:hypothetical protein
MIEKKSTSKNKRVQASSDAFLALPRLSSSETEIMGKWLQSDTKERRWESLLKAAGVDRLNRVEPLVHTLLHAGALELKETFAGGRWQAHAIVWRDVAEMQRAVGVRTKSERDASQDAIRSKLVSLKEGNAWVANAVDACLQSTAQMPARAELLVALVQWVQAQSQGLRQDFARRARGKTKAISPGEWKWLESEFSLEALGVGRFEPMLWLAGDVAFQRVDADVRLAVDAKALGFLGLPCNDIRGSLSVSKRPESYWLIENRACFERQARIVEPGVCIVWLPGRPSGDWLSTIEHLLTQAPAPAVISCDPDPAGIEITLTAGAVWQAQGLPWNPGFMAPVYWQDGTVLPLNSYDKRVLADLQTREDLSLELAQLRDYLLSSDSKAEQEGWL